jgi:hypothetical protein
LHKERGHQELRLGVPALCGLLQPTHGLDPTWRHRPPLEVAATHAILRLYAIAPGSARQMAQAFPSLSALDQMEAHAQPRVG